MKKYCTDCMFLSDESNYRYTTIKFRNDPTIKICHGMFICVARKEEIIVCTDTPIRMLKNKNIIVDNPYTVNKHNDCDLYKEGLLTRIFKKE